ncbi:MAG: 4'-phosphopantetheinyl transferase superfamily protein [Bacteroidales bacterium]|jgi:4'-phosphopantetheinyl transferase|nr:4'-phosphopantetheinyl transferase superfamily protein [Bacteroidales bacterium]
MFTIASLSDFSVEDLEKYAGMLPPEEFIRYNSFRNKKAQNLFLIGRTLVRTELEKKYGLPYDIHFEIEQNGKPILKDSNIFFNISHSNDYVAVAFAKTPTGIDMEKTVEMPRQTLLSMGEKVFSPKEMSMMVEWADRAKDEELQKIFTQMWTIKESFVKATGAGLAYSSLIDLIERIADEAEFYFEEHKYKCSTKCFKGDYFISVTVKIL